MTRTLQMAAEAPEVAPDAQAEVSRKSARPRPVRTVDIGDDGTGIGVLPATGAWNRAKPETHAACVRLDAAGLDDANHDPFERTVLHFDGDSHNHWRRRLSPCRQRRL